MPLHVVKPGECLSGIAHQYGFGDWQAIYSHEKNEELRSKRPNPNLLFPGDVVFIPERQGLSAQVATGRSHRFVIKRLKPKLIVSLRSKGEPLANRTCEVVVDRRVETLTTDGDGRLEIPLHPATPSVRLHIEGHDEEIVLKVGHLDPISEVSGLQGRLLALGFLRQTPDGKIGPATRRALRDFQSASGLQSSGEPDASTQHALEDAYGG